MITQTNFRVANEPDTERLQMQARVWEPAAEEMLNLVGVGPGWTCLDMGCGAMGILGALSRQIEPDGQVIGIDADFSQLSSARSYVQFEEFNNITLLSRDVTNTGLAANSFDFVHERFMFEYLATPERMLQEMLRLARPEGVVAVEETDHSSWNIWPTCPSWPRLMEVLEAAFALRGSVNIGRQAFGILKRAGLEDVRIHTSVLALCDRHPYMRLPILAANALRYTILDGLIATAMELDDLLAEVENCINDPETVEISFTTVQVWGRKPQLSGRGLFAT